MAPTQDIGIVYPDLQSCSDLNFRHVRLYYLKLTNGIRRVYIYIDRYRWGTDKYAIRILWLCGRKETGEDDDFLYIYIYMPFFNHEWKDQ